MISTITGDSKNIVKTSGSKKVSLAPNSSVIYITGANSGANWGPGANKQDFDGANRFKLITNSGFEVGGVSKFFQNTHGLRLIIC